MNTQDTYKKLFSFLHEIHPPGGLSHAVLMHIQAEQKRLAHRRRAVFGSIAFLSLVGTFPALALLAQDIASSGFYQYITLLVSDSSSVMTYGKTFIFSLAETVPVVSVALVLTLTTLFVWSLAQTLRYSFNTNKPVWI